MSTHEILILGGHFAGVGTAHTLLKKTIPALKKLLPTTNFHITIVTPSTHFFFNLSSPRELIGPDLVPVSTVFVPLIEGFKVYGDSIKIMYGKATGITPESKSVTIELNSGESEVLSYSSLVLATGQSYTSPLWAVNDSHERTIAAMSEMHALLPKAKTVLIGGGGALGVETAGEIASHHKHIKVILLSGTDRLLPRLQPATSATAESKLQRLGVSVEHKLRVTKEEKVDTAYTVLLSDGTSRTVDIYIDSTGGKPNTGFMPSTWLNERQKVMIDEKTLRVTALGATNVYAIGDIVSAGDGGIINLKGAFDPLCSSIGLDIAEAAGKRGFLKQGNWKMLKDSQVVPIGPKGGVGQMMGFRLPSTAVWLIKSRSYFVEMMPGIVMGSRSNFWD